MLSSNFYPAVLALAALLSQANGQVFPNCIRTCIDDSQYSNCQVTDLACLCRAGRSSGSFLPDLVTCMHNSCIDISVDILLSPLEVACVMAGASLPDSVVNAANSKASSLATETQTQMATTTATTEFTRVVQTTITMTEQGSTDTVVFPVTFERTKTVSGEPSTVTKDATASNSSSRSSALSSVLSSVVSSVRSSSSTSQESTTTILTSTTVLGGAVTSTIANTQSGAATSSPGVPASETDSAPFTNTNAAGKVVSEGSWFGMGILVVMGTVWF